MPNTPRAPNVLRSACRPAPPLGVGTGDRQDSRHSTDRVGRAPARLDDAPLERPAPRPPCRRRSPRPTPPRRRPPRRRSPAAYVFEVDPADRHDRDRDRALTMAASRIDPEGGSPAVRLGGGGENRPDSEVIGAGSLGTCRAIRPVVDRHAEKLEGRGSSLRASRVGRSSEARHAPRRPRKPARRRPGR